jgi:hypothetical protein
VADIFRHRGPAWRASHAGHVSLGQLKVMSAIEAQVLSRFFRRLFLERLTAAYQAGRLQFFTDQAALAQPAAFQTSSPHCASSNGSSMPSDLFAEPKAVLGYLSRYTHRTAIANSRLVAFDGERVTFKWKDYRAKADARYKLMTLDADEFIRRFLIHVLPDGFFIASATTASSPMPTGPTTLHLPAGSSLLSALAFPFLRVVGVELSPTLAEIAQQNLLSARLPVRRCFSSQIVRGDATEFPLPDGPSVVFFYNPIQTNSLCLKTSANPTLKTGAGFV